MSEPTPAEIDAGARALNNGHPPADTTWGRGLRGMVEIALRAVLPDHDARMRAELGDAIADQIIEMDRHTDCTADAFAATARAIARQYTTGEDGHG